MNKEQFTIGSLTWEVVEQERTDVDGITEPSLRRIVICNKLLDDIQRELTFYHELTHAILHTMGNELYSNEEFVNTFSTFLHQAITTRVSDNQNNK